MAYDADATERTVTRDRVMRLRDHLAKLQPEQFFMGEWKCGTAACIGGWAHTLFCPDQPFRDKDDILDVRATARALGLGDREAGALFFPYVTFADGRTGYSATIPEAVKVLDHYLATGEINWSVAK